MNYRMTRSSESSTRFPNVRRGWNLRSRPRLAALMSVPKFEDRQHDKPDHDQNPERDEETSQPRPGVLFPSKRPEQIGRVPERHDPAQSENAWCLGFPSETM